MKRLMIALLLGGQILVAAEPAFAAGLTGARTQQMGAFAGFRLRVPLDGNARQRQIRAGLAIAPALHSRRPDGETRTRFGDGLELGLTAERRLTLSLAGTPVNRVGAAQDEGETEEQGGGPSTLGWIAIGVGALVVVGATAGYLWLEDALDCDADEECS
jgi:hypothetical protein